VDFTLYRGELGRNSTITGGTTVSRVGFERVTAE
jgi:hypothetical protein